jgi:hypothetical protein
MNQPRDRQPLNDPKLALALDAIIDEARNDTPKIPAQVFYDLIMRPLTDRNVEVFQENWKRIAGALQRPIDVCDNDGNVVARAPSIVLSVPIRYANSPRESLSEIAEQARRHAELSPQIGEMYMADNMRGKNIPVTGHAQTMTQWNDLADKIGVPRPFVDGAPKSTDSEAADGAAAPQFSADEDEDF